VGALLIGALLATGAVGFAQDGSTTPTPTVAPTQSDTPSATDDAEDDDVLEEEPTNAPESDTEDESDESEGDRLCGGGKLLSKAAAAEVLGMTEEELREALASGQTLAEIAVAQGMTVEDFTAALRANIVADLDEALAAGEITQEEYDEKIASLDERLDDIINSTPSTGLRTGPGDGTGFGGPGRGFPGGETRFSPSFDDNGGGDTDA
jgi:hypothetical protein